MPPGLFGLASFDLEMVDKAPFIQIRGTFHVTQSQVVYTFFMFTLSKGLHIERVRVSAQRGYSQTISAIRRGETVHGLHRATIHFKNPFQLQLGGAFEQIDLTWYDSLLETTNDI